VERELRLFHFASPRLKRREELGGGSLTNNSPVVRGIEKVLASGDLDKIIKHVGPYCAKDRKQARYLTNLGKELNQSASR